MTETFDAVTSYEPLIKPKLRMIAAALGPIQCMVVRLGDVDISRGSGSINDRTRCVWTKDGRRITFELLPDIGFMAAISNTPDPDAPAAK